MKLITMKTPQQFVDEWSYTLTKNGEAVTRQYSDATKKDILREFATYKVYLKDNKLYDENLLAFFLDKDAFLKYVYEKSSSNDTRKKLLSHVSSYLKFNNVVDTEGLTIYSKLISEIGKKAIQNNGKDKIEDNDEYVTKIRQLPESTFTEIRDKLLLILHVCYPPRRSDCAQIKVRNVKKGDASYDFENNVFVYPNLIKVDRQGTTHISAEDAQLVKKLVDSHNCDYLFCFKANDGSFKPYVAKSFCKLIGKVTERLLGKKMCVSQLRKLYSSNAYAKAETPKQQQEVVKQLATDMGNSVDTQFNYYLHPVSTEQRSQETEMVKLCVNGLIVIAPKGTTITLL